MHHVSLFLRLGALGLPTYPIFVLPLLSGVITYYLSSLRAVILFGGCCLVSSFQREGRYYNYNNYNFSLLEISSSLLPIAVVPRLDMTQ